MTTKSNNIKDKYNSIYSKRVNTTYQDYFEKRYKVFLDKILEINPPTIIEEGIGIGSVSKFLMKNTNISCRGYDINSEMVDLCKLNNNGLSIAYTDNILQPDKSIIPHLVITHGVLEHFSDIQILSIFTRYKRRHQSNIHYVPLDLYKQPSIGDERLLSLKYWIDLIGDDVEYTTFNDGHDLMIYKKYE